MKQKYKFKNEIDKARFIALMVFIGIITLLAWQSDDAYHGYVMSKHLVEGNGLVYNIGERASASSCPLFTLIISAAYFMTREMYFTSIFVCVAFSSAAFYIVIYKLCKNKEQVFFSLAALIGSSAFVSYTTSGLENSLLFFLCTLFLKLYFDNETYTGKQLLSMALVFSAVALARMDAVLMLIPMICFAFLVKRKNTTFFGAVGIGLLGLSPFILWEVFSTFYFGFPVPNTAYVKLGTDIALIEYIKRGIWYIIFTSLNDIMVLIIPVVFIIFTIFLKKAKYIYTSAGVALYFLYIIYIGGDFMMGRHFTVLLIISLSSFIVFQNKEKEDFVSVRKTRNIFNVIVIGSIIYSFTFVPVIGSQYLFGHQFSSSISDEREVYSKTTGFYNNIKSLIETGELCVKDTWNYQSTDEIRENGLIGNITDNSPGILVFYNSDLYLNDAYGLGDPFLSKLPAIKDENWRVGHMKREIPSGYRETVQFGKNIIEDENLHEYYEIIRTMTRGDLFSKERIQTVIDWNLGKYDYLLENYEKSILGN
ncbi:MAG: hypothetical protein PHY47_22015 [Lachnospiraceae bacterium]|nr:hypothetical protein [Lachnospiraceae bacterium]